MIQQGLGEGFDPSDMANLGVGVILVAFAGQLMRRLWNSWSEYATQVNTRGTRNEDRADEISEKYAVALAEIGGLKVKVVYLEQDVAERDQAIAERDAIISSLRERLG